jgi:hypothetical protein
MPDIVGMRRYSGTSNTVLPHVFSAEDDVHVIIHQQLFSINNKPSRVLFKSKDCKHEIIEGKSTMSVVPASACYFLYFVLSQINLGVSEASDDICPLIHLLIS